MTWRDNLHSRMVAWMKILLPLVALALLSTLFLVSKRFDPSKTEPPSGLDLQERARHEGARNATLSGVTRAGHEVFVQSTRFVPSSQGPQRLLAENLTVTLRLKDGMDVRIGALRGEIDQDHDHATLSGNVTIDTSSGYSLKSDLLSIQYDALRVVSPGPVSGTAPAGDLTAGRMRLLRQKADGDAFDLFFADGVKLIYQPQRTGE